MEISVARQIQKANKNNIYIPCIKRLLPLIASSSALGQVHSCHVMSFMSFYHAIHVIMLVICHVEMRQDAALTPVSDCVVYYYPE